ncbi:putative bifunctional diguanylate cyclase/phosphodiesterase [Devosia nitrariae]|uniref:EAL domain-containing protein n=1 Tax=Devosia nitrariae TaxID=2071872 RepID=A0ABQ5W9Z1_9HYPH|nr:EAL domain-containing protein [Devosia nitrariae]GLQ56915.1 hypothetical protein GCM10010862_41740 [Devosia nitrariae]
MANGGQKEQAEAKAAWEVRRQAAVKALAILDTPPTPEFEALVDIVGQTLGVPICGISLIDDRRQWFKALRGLGLKQMPREHAFCNRLIESGAPLVISDLAAESASSSHPLVAGGPRLRFYAGAPLTLEDGLVVGAICVFDTAPRVFEKKEAEALSRLAGIAEGLLRQFESAEKLARLSREAEAHLRLVEDQRRQLFQQHRVLSQASVMARIGAWERDLATGAYRWSEGMYRLHEVGEDFVVDEEAVFSFYPRSERRRIAGVIARARKANTSYRLDAQIVTGKGNRRWVRISSEAEMIDGVPVRRFGIMRDITDEKEAADRIASMAERDALTGLYNRAFLQTRIDGLAETVPGRRHAFLLLDLDGFKDINDTHGHAAGDECLRRVSRRIGRAAGRGALVARIGGDEFAILVEESQGRDARALARHVRKAIQVPLRWQGQAFQLSASIGIAYWPGTGPIRSDALFADADLALYDAKGAGKNCDAVYRVELKAEATQRFAIVRDISRALKRGNLELYYQPKVRLADGAHRGFEALLRWVREDGSVVAAGAFGPALKDPGLSVEIGHFVLRSGLEQAAEWQRQGLAFGSVAINLGASQFRHRNLARTILEHIASLGLPPGSIEVEVTEDVFLSRAAGYAPEICRDLKQGGVTIAFDDFGTGFASLTHLREFPVDVLKIDRSFISRLGTDASTTSIVHAVIDLAHNLDLQTVAEGVETEGQAQFLRAVGCEWAQGYLYARPMDARSVPAYLGAAERLRA